VGAVALFELDEPGGTSQLSRLLHGEILHFSVFWGFSAETRSICLPQRARYTHDRADATP
jgi:hypothetical protein